MRRGVTPNKIEEGSRGVMIDFLDKRLKTSHSAEYYRWALARLSASIIRFCHEFDKVNSIKNLGVLSAEKSILQIANKVMLKVDLGFRDETIEKIISPEVTDAD